ncbi:hypothetical protein STRCI_000269 [Streptomyces cinnabarinus]|uniref:Lipoprotein n=1 Tax=Streptomyces cinnabarinus TaxID=67287 RepID=A0ABY7K8G6_9ACTN|nr:hypothetical protein [Streptomyces cinnabarinus]WAZ19234.1 hypothetical protein STRCI_000269 [Streptomyces cinnabarinus]
MRTTVARARLLVTAAGLALVVGCGGAEPSTPAAASPAPFDQRAVRADLEAAVAVAGLPEGRTKVEAGESPGPGATNKERKLAALTARLSPCTVSWFHHQTGASDQDRMRGNLDVALSDLVARGWKKTGADDEVPLGDDGTHFMATYKKRGWTLHARHSTLATWSDSSAVATEDTCFDRLTDEETALLER